MGNRNRNRNRNRQDNDGKFALIVLVLICTGVAVLFLTALVQDLHTKPIACQTDGHYMITDTLYVQNFRWCIPQEHKVYNLGHKNFPDVVDGITKIIHFNEENSIVTIVPCSSIGIRVAMVGYYMSYHCVSIETALKHFDEEPWPDITRRQLQELIYWSLIVRKC